MVKASYQIVEDGIDIVQPGQYFYHIGAGIGVLLCKDDSEEYCQGLSHMLAQSGDKRIETYVERIAVHRGFTSLDMTDSVQNELLSVMLSRQSARFH